MSECVKSFSVWRLGVAVGLTWSLGMLMLGLISTSCGWGTEMVQLFGTVYIGFDSTWLGSIIGAAWAFIDGLIGGIVIAFIYNWLAR